MLLNKWTDEHQQYTFKVVFDNDPIETTFIVANYRKTFRQNNFGFRRFKKTTGYLTFNSKI